MTAASGAKQRDNAIEAFAAGSLTVAATAAPEQSRAEQSSLEGKRKLRRKERIVREGAQPKSVKHS